MSYSKSWKQARMMLEQCQVDLPEGVERRVPAAAAQQFVDGDHAVGYFYGADGNLKPAEECPGPVPPESVEAAFSGEPTPESQAR